MLIFTGILVALIVVAVVGVVGWLAYKSTPIVAEDNDWFFANWDEDTL